MNYLPINKVLLTMKGKMNVMDNKELASKIIEYVGEPTNIINAIHCATRLRFSLKDQKIVHNDKVKALDGVIGLVNSGDQYQIIIGQKVPILYKEIAYQLGENKADKKQDKKEDIPKRGFGGTISYGITVFSEMLTPLVPGLAAVGMLKVILVLLMQTKILSTESTTYQLLDIMSDSLLYFLPIVVAFFAAYRLDVNKVLSVVIVAVLLHPKFYGLAASSAVTFLGVPVKIIAYNGVLIPPILTVIVLKYVDKFLDKIIPSMVKLILQPMLAIIIVTPILLTVLGPIGYWLGEFVGQIATVSYEKFGWLTLGILGAILPFTVITGINRALAPVSSSLGYELLFRTPILLEI